MNYYNEIDRTARRWLRELVKDGLIPDGYIDNRPIQEVKAHELGEFTQCHFFAGIGGWPLAFRIAGIPDDEPLWSGSCPCQPFSDSGEQMGFRDPRHLFPTWRRLIARGHPAKVYGEQVASALGREWLARVRLEMATLGYATRGTDLCSAGVASPNRRQRLFWMADSGCRGRQQHAKQHSESEQASPDGNSQGEHARGCGGLRGLGDTRRERNELFGQCGNAPSASEVLGGQERQQRSGNASGNAGPCGNRRMGDTDHKGWQGRRLRSLGYAGQGTPWSSGVVGIRCTDGKTRRIKPEIFPLATRLPGDLGLIRGAGNAINPWITAEFILSCEE